MGQKYSKKDGNTLMSLKVQVNADALAAMFKQFSTEVKQDIVNGMGQLASATYAKIKEMAQNEIKDGSMRKTYVDAVKYEELNPGVWVVSLDEDASWIEDGIPKNTDMKPALLKNAKTAANGNRWRAIPFRYDQGPTRNTPATNNLINDIKLNIRQQMVKDSFDKQGKPYNKVPFKGIEYGADGKPKQGKLHTFDFGGPIPGKGNTPALKGLSIYQSVKNGKARRDILTFRTVSSGPGSQGKWIHPGMDGKKFFDKAYEWAMQEWDKTILPEIVKKWE